MNTIYKLQKDDYSCGPIALMNAYKYVYNIFPKISLRKLLKECKTDPINYGTYRWNIIESSLSNIIYKKPTYSLDKMLNYDAFILLYSFNEKYAHYIFVVNCKDTTYNLYNFIHEDKYVNIKVTKKYFLNNILKFNPKIDDLDYPLAWNIRSTT
jgi:hypothetical protein